MGYTTFCFFIIREVICMLHWPFRHMNSIYLSVICEYRVTIIHLVFLNHYIDTNMYY